ncbi:MAG: hypothetical protein KC776_38190 [Myxococcales bacterium]|nr:hypothetical protein [Myxococcales bacterium]MCB9579959.1 hypothetical protein [Polyangiaceae bacterium]
MSEAPRSVRRLWIRPLLFGIAVVTLPFPWVEVQGTCGAPMHSPEVSTGAQLLTKDPAPAIVLATLVVLSLALLFLAPRLTRGLRIVVQLAGSVANATVLFLTWFLATFVLFANVKLKAPVIIASVALVATLVESLWRMTLDLYALLAERHERR